MGIFVKNDDQIAIMRTAGRICAGAHEALARHIRPGITTGELNEIVHEYIRGQDATPSFLGYKGYPAAACISVNNEVIHGIPGMRKLKNGDIVSVDIGVSYKRFHGDAARTHAVGMVSDKHRRLIDATEQAFFEALRHMRAGSRLHDLSAAIEDYIDSQGFNIVEEWCGHGIGRQIHEDPQIPNTRQEKRGPRLSCGMTLAVEPMVNAGTGETTTLQDTWTVVTSDGEYSAHYENTVLITDGEPDILTLP